MSPIPGTFCIDLFIVLFIRPAIANVCPFCSSSSVSVRRVDSAGMRNPCSVIALVKSSVLTSGRTFRCTRSPFTCGVKFRRMPNSFHMIVTATPAPPGCATGIGISPPARKLASLPLSATRFGSARLWNRPRVCSALTTAPRSFLKSQMKKFRKSLKISLFPPLWLSKVGAGYCPVVTRPMTLWNWPSGLVKKLTPSSVSALRDTSANRTRSST